MKLTKTQIILVALVIFLAVIFIGVLVFFGRRAPTQAGYAGRLTVWGVFDRADAFEKLIEGYRKLQPGVEINYVQKNPATYESELVNALATPNGPDVFMFHNTWLPKHFDKIVPVTPSTYTIDQFKIAFPTIVIQDFAPDGSIYATPLYIDTLALFYNKDFFDQKGSALPPENWDAFQKLVLPLREIDRATNRLYKAAAAIGGSNASINRATDLLGLLMLQTGTKMVSDNFGSATFVSREGLEAFNFYTSFANPANLYYTWDDNFSYSLDAFAQGDVGMIFNYAYQANLLREKNPFLNFRVVPMLQPSKKEKEVNYANYWGMAVSAKSPRSKLAWNFILNVTTNADVAKPYIEVSQHPPALRSLIDQYVKDPDLGIFAKQALTARSWPQVDNTLVETALSDAISAVLSGRSQERALREAAEKISAKMIPRNKPVITL